MASFNLSAAQAQILVNEANAPFAPMLIDQNTFKVDKIQPSGNFTTKQTIYVTYSYNPTGGGRKMVRTLKFHRFKLDSILGDCLPREEFYLLLPTVDPSLGGIIEAINQMCNVTLTPSDVTMLNSVGPYIQLTCSNKSLGWFGDFAIKVVDPTNAQYQPYPWIDFVKSASERFTDMVNSSINPLLLWLGSFKIIETKPVRRTGSNVRVTLKIDNMLRPGARLSQVLEKPYTTRTIYRTCVDLEALPDNVSQGIYYQPMALPITLPMVLTFVNAYFEIDIDVEDVAQQFFNPSSSKIAVVMKNDSPFYKGRIVLNVI